MATRSYIGKRLEDGSILAIYCHWDGYPEHNGCILLNHYFEEQKIDQLLALGALSLLGEELGTKQDFNNPTKGYCLAYSRDRGDEFSSTVVLRPRDLLSSVDYVYIWENNCWVLYTDRGRFAEF